MAAPGIAAEAARSLTSTTDTPGWLIRGPRSKRFASATLPVAGSFAAEVGEVASVRTVDSSGPTRALPNDGVLLVAADSVDLAVITLAHPVAGDRREGR